ncbi:MAG: extracellular solute-binding protein [Reichenbachiella sp.]
MSKNIILNGITWNHSRGFTSVVATAQRFQELNPNIEIRWQKRSLQAFADEPLNELAARFDLLVIDHPWAGFAARTGAVVPLDEKLSEAFMKDQADNSVGKSFESYSFNDHQWALPIDAATPVAASRPDLLSSPPENFDQLIELSKSGKVAIPGIPQDTLMSFYMICSTLGEDVCQNESQVVSNKTGLQALELLRQLGRNINNESYDFNPIQVYEVMTQTDDYSYSPFAYGYTNYSRTGYARKLLKFHDMVAINGQKLISTLGGTGLAISSQCKEQEAAHRYAEFTGAPETQKGLFFDNGGQPGHRLAWKDKAVNDQCMDFFKDTLPALDRSFLRPRYHGHMYFQDRAGAPIREFMMKGGEAENVLNYLNELYQESLKETI